ncbi:MAG: ABC transporter ATP-binding protein [Pseudomonadota bacterium]
MRASDQERSISLRTERVRVGYGKEDIVKDLSLEVRNGTFTVLAGPNGCGKSTLLKALSGVLPTSGGAIFLDERPIKSLSVKAIARRIGILAQSPSNPEGLTVEDLVKQGRYPHRGLFSHWKKADSEACEEALELTGLRHLASRSLASLSGGQRQRAWIAMTLAQKTDILLLDEPTTFLDIAHQVEVLGLLRNLVDSRGATIVAVLHDINQAAQYADRVVLMKDGQIQSEGATQSVINAGSMRSVFGVEAQVIANPLDGTPLMLLEGRHG